MIPITTFAGKGSSLLYTEMDANFTALQAAVGGLNGLYAYTASVALTASQIGALISFTGSTAAQTITLMQCAALGATSGQSVMVRNNSSVPVTVASFTGETMNNSSGVANSNLLLQVGQSMLLVNQGSSTVWDIVGGSMAAEQVRNGSWTPVLAQTGLTIGQTVAGYYSKVGNVVTISGTITITSLTGTASGTPTIGVLPFSVLNAASCTSRENGIGGFLWNLVFYNNSTQGWLYRYENTNVLVNGMIFTFSMSYLTSN